MDDLGDLPTKNAFDGALAIVDGKYSNEVLIAHANLKGSDQTAQLRSRSEPFLFALFCSHRAGMVLDKSTDTI